MSGHSCHNYTLYGMSIMGPLQVLTYNLAFSWGICANLLTPGNGHIMHMPLKRMAGTKKLTPLRPNTWKAKVAVLTLS